MGDSKKKVLVVALAALVFVPVVAWRSLQAMNDSPSGDWDQLITEERLADAPSWFTPREVFSLREEPKGPHLRLATLRFVQPRSNVDGWVGTTKNFPPLYRRAEAMRANASFNEAVDEDVPGMAEGSVQAVQAVFLVHAGPVPEAMRARVKRHLCQATDVFANSASEEAGLVAGDDFIEVGDVSIIDQPDQCAALVRSTKQPPGTRLRLVMLRDGEQVELTLLKRGDDDGFAYDLVPILDAR